MSDLIKRLLREAMISQLDDWEININYYSNDNIFATLISEDDESGDKLFLFVALKDYTKYSEFSYSFIVIDKDNKPKS